jgi:glutathione synthase
MDPLEGVLVHHDSTFALMLECERRGHEVRCFEQKDLWFDGLETSARMRTVSVRRVQGEHFSVLEAREAPISELDVLFLRKDPPVDVEFLHATQLVELSHGDGPFMVNSPSALRDANEKLFPLRYPDLMPPTFISRDREQLRDFVERLGVDAVLKPVDGYGGKAVFQTRAGDRNLASILDVLTDWGKQAIVAQAFVPESREGDKRIILLDGDPVGAVLRVPREDDVRANLAVGGRAVKTTLTDRDREICTRLAPELRWRGLHFVGIDVLGPYLTEVNVTSPTGIAEIDALNGVAVEARVIDFVEEKVREREGVWPRSGNGLSPMDLGVIT